MDPKERELRIDLLMSRIRDQALAETRRHPANAEAPCECGASPGEEHDFLCNRFYRARMAREQQLHQEVLRPRSR